MPNLAELVKLHKDRKFTLLGINAYDSPESYRAGVEEFDVSWRVAFDGEEPAICKQYRVGAFPTIFVLDPEGRIAAANLHGEGLARKVGELLDAMEAASQ